MAEIPSGTKFLGVGSSVPTPELSGTAINSKTQYYTIEDLQGLIRPYKVYSALLTQSDTDAPVATVLENTTGEDFTISRSNTGQYRVNCVPIFEPQLDNIYVSLTFFTGSAQTDRDIKLLDIDDEGLEIGSFSLGEFSDDILYKTPIEIRVYSGPGNVPPF